MMLKFLLPWRQNREWRAKLRAFLDGLECSNVDDLMDNAERNDYFRMGLALKLRHKLLQIHFDETKTAVDATVSYLKYHGSEPYLNLWSTHEKKSDG